jgi:Berberine and berberine like
LIAAEIVTADGRLVRVDAENHPDLFWAIRGGGGNFGVATRFQYRLHQVGTVVGGMLILPATPETIAAFISEAESAPDDLSTIANVMPAPPMPFVPEESYGQLVIMALMSFAGDVAAGQRVVERFRALAPPIVDMVRPISYPEIYPPDEEGYHPIATGRTFFLDSFDEKTAEMIVDRLQASTAPMRVAQLRVLGGAMSRVPIEATAFAHRRRRMMVAVAAVYETLEDEAVHAPWVSEFASVLAGREGGAYVGFLADEGEGRIRQAYPGATWNRLTAIKHRYDPTNLFHLNQNIPPSVDH